MINDNFYKKRRKRRRRRTSTVLLDTISCWHMCVFVCADVRRKVENVIELFYENFMNFTVALGDNHIHLSFLTYLYINIHIYKAYTYMCV